MTIYSSLLKLITSDVRVVIWFENKPLDKNLPLFKTMDYVLGDLLTKHLEQMNVVEEGTFVTSTFEKPFYLFFQMTKKDKIPLGILNQAEKEKVIVINPELAEAKLIKQIENDFRWVDFLKAEKINQLH